MEGIGGDSEREGGCVELFLLLEVERLPIDRAPLPSDGFCEGVIGGGCVQSVGEPVFEELGSKAPAYLASLISVRG